MTKLIERGAGSSATTWRDRAAKLFQLSSRADSAPARELLRRRAVAADNIADAVDLDACQHRDANTPEGAPDHRSLSE